MGMTLEELGPGYHLVPITDHCRVSKARWRVIIRDHWTGERWTQFYTDPTAARRTYEKFAGDPDYTATLHKPRRRFAQKPYTGHCDPMALQAIAILKAVRRQFWEEEGRTGWLI